jgi:hypothetical protein
MYAPNPTIKNSEQPTTTMKDQIPPATEDSIKLFPNDHKEEYEEKKKNKHQPSGGGPPFFFLTKLCQ